MKTVLPKLNLVNSFQLLKVVQQQQKIRDLLKMQFQTTKLEQFMISLKN